MLLIFYHSNKILELRKTRNLLEICRRLFLQFLTIIWSSSSFWSHWLFSSPFFVFLRRAPTLDLVLLDPGPALFTLLLDPNLRGRFRIFVLYLATTTSPNWHFLFNILMTPNCLLSLWLQSFLDLCYYFWSCFSDGPFSFASKFCNVVK